MNERQYDQIQNEGYMDGYNPYRAAREEKELRKEIARPKSIGERKDLIYRRLEILDCSIARECGTYDQAKIDQLRADLKILDAEENAGFLASWTIDITKERRISWNDKVRAGTITPKNMMQAQISQGWRFEDLKKAIKIYNL